MKSNQTFTIPCPICEQELTVELAPGHPAIFCHRDGSGTPADSPEIEELTGCPHADALADDDAFYEAVCAAAEARDRDSYDREMEARGERDWDLEEGGEG